MNDILALPLKYSNMVGLFIENEIKKNVKRTRLINDMLKDIEIFTIIMNFAITKM